MNAPVAESESAAARILAPWTPPCIANGGAHGVARAGSFRKWRKEEEIGSWAERWKDKRAARKQGKQRKQSDSDETVYADIDSPHQPWRKVLQQPL
jgi:hypothetical protein